LLSSAAAGSESVKTVCALTFATSFTPEQHI